MAIPPALSIGATLQGLARLLTGPALATFAAFAGVVAVVASTAPRIKRIVLPGVSYLHRVFRGDSLLQQNGDRGRDFSVRPQY